MNLQTGLEMLVRRIYHCLAIPEDVGKCLESAERMIRHDLIAKVVVTIYDDQGIIETDSLSQGAQNSIHMTRTRDNTVQSHLVTQESCMSLALGSFDSVPAVPVCFCSFTISLEHKSSKLHSSESYPGFTPKMVFWPAETGAGTVQCPQTPDRTSSEKKGVEIPVTSSSAIMCTASEGGTTDESSIAIPSPEYTCECGISNDDSVLVCQRCGRLTHVTCYTLDEIAEQFTCYTCTLASSSRGVSIACWTRRIVRYLSERPLPLRVLSEKTKLAEPKVLALVRPLVSSNILGLDDAGTYRLQATLQYSERAISAALLRASKHDP